MKISFRRRSDAKDTTARSYNPEHQAEVGGGMVADEPHPQTGRRLPNWFRFGARRNEAAPVVNSNNAMREVPRPVSIADDETYMDDYSFRSQSQV
jgi:hypothetical protein